MQKTMSYTTLHHYITFIKKANARSPSCFTFHFVSLVGRLNIISHRRDALVFPTYFHCDRKKHIVHLISCVSFSEMINLCWEKCSCHRFSSVFSTYSSAAFLRSAKTVFPFSLIKLNYFFVARLGTHLLDYNNSNKNTLFALSSCRSAASSLHMLLANEFRNEWLETIMRLHLRWEISPISRKCVFVF